MSHKIYVGSKKVFDPVDYDVAGAAAAAVASHKSEASPHEASDVGADPAGAAAGLVGTLASLLTTAKTNIVAAVNEVIGYIGTLASLTTTAKSSLVAAVNELVTSIGSLASLTTTAKTSTVAAINELDSQLSAIEKSLENNANVHYVVWDKVNATCTRGGASASVTTTTTNFGHFGSVNANYSNPFDQFYPWLGRKLCNVDIATYRSVYADHGNLLDCVVAWEGDVDFALDGSNGFVGVYTPEFWGLRKELAGNKEFLGVSPVEITGWNHYEETIGARWFGVADSTGITSKPGLPVINETMAAIHARATAYDMTLDDIYTWAADSLLLAVEYATLNTQYAIGSGADAVYVQGVRPYVSESAVNRVVMTDAQSANFRTGVIIDIGTSDGGYQIARRIVTSVEDYPTDSAYAIVNFDGAPVNVDTAHYVSAHGTSNVEDSNILSTSGYIGTNGKCNAYYRGRVAHANLWRYVLGAYRQTGNGRIWIAKSRAEAAAYDALNTGVHTDTGFGLPTTSNYIASLHFGDHLFPFAKTVGGGSDKPVGDYCYVPTLATGNTVLRAGGSSNNGADDGRFYGTWALTASSSSWSLSGLPFLKTP